MKVKQILGNKSGNVITVTPEQTLHEASLILTEHNIGAVVVVGTDHTPVGILSERDIIRMMASQGAAVMSHIVSDAMTEDVIVGYLDDDLASVSSTMTNRRIRHLPIMQGDDLVGMVSIGDIVKAQLTHVENEAHNLRQYITGGYN